MSGKHARKIPFSLKKWVFFICLILTLSIIGFLWMNAKYLFSPNIYKGVYVGETYVGGMSTAEALQVVNQAFAKTISKPIILTHEINHWNLSAQELSLHIEAEKLVEEAYAVGRKGNILQKLSERYFLKNHSYVIPRKIEYDSGILQNRIQALAIEIDQSPENAVLNITDRAYEITPEKIGYKLNVQKACKEIEEKLSSNPSFTYELPVERLNPSIKQEDLESINTLISSYTTEFPISDVNRTQNIYIAARSLNHTFLKNGQGFSFNEQVGLRSPQNGYLEAPGYINGVLVPDWGGGVCQVSSTLYNAVLLANLTIDERSCHFHPPGYVPLGQDATVADNLLDFQFHNNSGSNLYIQTSISGNQLTVSLHGNKNVDFPQVRIISEILKVLNPKLIVKQDASLSAGTKKVEEEGENGYKVATYRIIYKNGQEISRHQLYVDTFPPVDQVIIVGTKKSIKRKTN